MQSMKLLHRHDLKLIGLTLRMRRKEKGWTREGAAEKAGTSINSVVAAESGNPKTLEIFARVCHALGYTLRLTIKE